MAKGACVREACVKSSGLTKLFTRCCWFSVAAGWVAAEGKQTKCHSLPDREGGQAG